MNEREVLVAEHLSKKYIINHQARFDTLREMIGTRAKRFARGLIGKGDPIKSESAFSTKATSEEFWALNDVSFSVTKGERVGIIGRNGAGKSTLLKILSRVTSPTSGTVTTRGKITSLLEIGTGFHPDLTGRENVFLNGSIMGMSKAEIKANFDQIVEFSEVEKFLDTPVKHYSSGMQVRLAFSVAAHLTPDILILDEVLAVGDFKFSQKCLKRMEEINASGCTVIFVSHSLDAVEKYCKRAIVLTNGSVMMDTHDMEKALDIYKNL